MTASELTEHDTPEMAKFDPVLVERWMAVLRPVVKAWLRSEVKGLDRIAPGGVLLVSNHSGGALPTDAPVFASDYYQAYTSTGRSAPAGR